jgi:hypothetical protein
MRSSHFNKVLDTKGCAGDFEIANTNLHHLAREFNLDEYSVMKFRILDLILMFQNHDKVNEIHSMLTELLLAHRTLNNETLIAFFESQNFQEYIIDENLDLDFFQNRT